MSVKTVSQCTAHKKGGERCKIRTGKVGPKCWIHTKYQDGLAVKKSNIPGAGLGLFAVKQFDRGDKISEYKGERLTEMQLEHKTNTDYVLRVDQNTYIDADHTNSSPARYSNDCHGQRQYPCNARFSIDKKKHKATIKAQKKIRPGQEVLTPYGAGYWSKSTQRNAAPNFKRQTLNSKRARTEEVKEKPARYKNHFRKALP